MSSNLPGHHFFDHSHVVREWIVPFILIIVAMVGARWAVVSDLNLLAAAACLVAGMGLGTAIVSPKAGLYLLIFTTGYIDYFKRFTVVMGMVSLQDIAVILSISPLIFVCVILGIISHAIFRRVTIRPIDRKFAFFILAIMGAGTMVIFRDTSSVEETLKAGANSVGYVPLLVVVGLVFQTPEETGRFLRHAAFILLPVPLYAVWQQMFGPTQVEYEYLKTGLTITSGLLNDTHFRPFSTMASPHPLSISCATFFVLSLIPQRLNPSRGLFSWLTWKWHIIGAIFMIGCLASVARTGWVCAFLGLLATFCFKRKLLTKLLYGLAITSLVLLIVNAKWIENNIGEFEAYLPMDSVLGEQAFRLGTLGDRLIGWQNILNNSGVFRPFGISKEERDELVYVHDQIGDILVNYGYAGLAAAFCILAWALIKAHTMIWRQTNIPAFRLAVGCLSAIFGILVSGAMFGGHTSVFPVNVYFWFLGGTLLQVLNYREGQLPGPQSIRIEPPARTPRRRDPRTVGDRDALPRPPLTPRL